MEVAKQAYWLEVDDNRHFIVDPEQISGFSTETVSNEVVAVLIASILENAHQEGASALGLDLDSTEGIVNAEISIPNRLRQGATVLHELATRQDDATWMSWFGRAMIDSVAHLHGEESYAHRYVQEILIGWPLSGQEYP